MLKQEHPTSRDAKMRILVCPSGFKGSLQPERAADCIAAGIQAVESNTYIRKVPFVDGGEGFTRAIVTSKNGAIHGVPVTGPSGKPVSAFFGIIDGNGFGSRTAVLEMAAAAGLSLVPFDQRNPGKTTTYGVGELIKATLDAGATRILVGCGDSGTCDGGAGMLQALGARLYDSRGRILPTAQGGESLLDLSAIDLTSIDKRLASTKIDVAVNWHNILCGPGGVASVFGPQKGATPRQTAQLSASMDALAKIAGQMLNEPGIGFTPGSGASGGLGTGLRLIGANLLPRYEVVTQYINLNEMLDDCDLVITAEGSIDDQTPRGKIPAEVARLAKQRDLPVIAIAGTIGPGARVNYDFGIDAFTCILQRPTTLPDAISEAEILTRESAECVMRMVNVGRMLKPRY